MGSELVSNRPQPTVGMGFRITIKGPGSGSTFNDFVKEVKEMASSGAGGSVREGSAKASVADQISQAVQSTSNIVHLMQQSSPAHAQLVKLPKNLLAKTSTINNTGHVLGQMPGVISSLDVHMENGLKSVPHLKTVIQLLANMESCQLNSLSQAHFSQKEHEAANEPSRMD